MVQQRKKSKELFVTKKDIIENEPTMDKDYLSNFTMKYPEILEKLKKDMLNNSKPMNGNILDKINVDTIYNILLNKLKSISTGSCDAPNFHNLMIGIFELLLYPNLIKQKKNLKLTKEENGLIYVLQTYQKTDFLLMFQIN